MTWSISWREIMQNRFQKILKHSWNNAKINTKIIRNISESPRRLSTKMIFSFQIMKSFLGGMIERNSGHIVPICSMASFVAAPKLVDYASTKYALLGFMEGLQNEMKYMRKDGIQFTIVCPHWINTRLIRQLGYLIYESGNLLRPIIYYHKTSCRKTNTNSRFSFCSIRAIEIFRKQFIHFSWHMI